MACEVLAVVVEGIGKREAELAVVEGETAHSVGGGVGRTAE